MSEDGIEYYEDITEQEDAITEDASAPIVCKSCGGGKWRSGRKDEAQLARRNDYYVRGTRDVHRKKNRTGSARTFQRRMQPVHQHR